MSGFGNCAFLHISLSNTPQQQPPVQYMYNLISSQIPEYYKPHGMYLMCQGPRQ